MLDYINKTYGIARAHLLLYPLWYHLHRVYLRGYQEFGAKGPLMLEISLCGNNSSQKWISFLSQVYFLAYLLFKLNLHDFR